MMWRKAVGLFLMACGALVPLVIALRHPDMTNMRLFITFWPEYLLDLVIIILGAMFYEEVWRDE